MIDNRRFVTTVIAIIMSFMILTNLANIYVSRKKKELIVMRINGFSVSKTIHYLARETIVTTVLGLTLGVLAGSLGNELVMRLLEQPDVQFIRTINPLAWIIAVGLESFFAIIIYSTAFRRVKHLNFREIL